MARISGVDIPREKRLEIALTYIYGIGLSTAQKICAEADVSVDTRVRDLTEEEVARLPPDLAQKLLAFIGRAPAEVIEENRARQAAAEESRARLQAILARLEAVG